MLRALLAHGFLLVYVHALPPLGEEGDLGPDELAPGVLLQLHHHVVEDVLCLVGVILVKCFYPACRADVGFSVTLMS